MVIAVFSWGLKCKIVNIDMGKFRTVYMFYNLFQMCRYWIQLCEHFLNIATNGTLEKRIDELGFAARASCYAAFITFPVLSGTEKGRCS